MKEKHIHGGDIYRYKDILDFSANINPLGTPDSVKKAVADAMETANHYPDIRCQELREALSKYEEIPVENIICGNGAADLIFNLVRAVKPKKALLMAPTFAEYEQALRSMGCEIDYYMLKKEHGFYPDRDFISAITDEIDMVFLCNPNNPTGVLLKREELLPILEQCEKTDTFLVVDECFLDFVDEPELCYMKQYLETNKNLFLLKAFTKRYAMAGVRLGYGLCHNQELLAKMQEVTQPWNVSTLAQRAGVAALKEVEYLEQGRQIVKTERQYLRKVLEETGCLVFASNANYMFFQVKETYQEDLKESLIREGVLIRDCSNYPGLTKGYYRIAVRTHEENVRFAKALKNGCIQR